jgi:hypothetical protein
MQNPLISFGEIYSVINLIEIYFWLGVVAGISYIIKMQKLHPSGGVGWTGNSGCVIMVLMILVWPVIIVGLLIEYIYDRKI